jgi:hypothetical protein
MSYSASFLANMFFWRTEGYFTKAAELNPLLHLWSLGVEEQFYLAWPILLMLAVRCGVTMRVLVAIFATSLAISIWGAWYAPKPHFFLPTSRAWELAAGGVLAAWQLAGPTRYPGLFGARALSLAGLALIVLGGLCWTVDDPIPGAWSVIPTAGAVGLLAAGPQAPVNRWLLSTRPLTFVGRISYPLYLWHWPPLAFTRVIIGHLPEPNLAAAEITIASIAAYATYRLVEAPIRFGQAGRGAVPPLLAGLVALALIGAAISVHQIPGRLSGPLILKWNTAVTDWHYPSDTNIDPRSGLGRVEVASHRKSKALFIGDSHIQHYWARVKYLIDSQPDSARSAVFATYYGCPPMPGISGTWRHWNCSHYFNYAMEQAARPDVDTVVFGAYWEKYFLGEYSVDHSQQQIYGSRADSVAPLRLDSPGTQLAFQQFRDVVEQMVTRGQRVFIVLSNPTSPLFIPRFPAHIRLALHLPKDFSADTAPRLDAGPFEAFAAPVINRLRDIAAQTGARVVDPRSTLCDRMTCPAVDSDGIPLYLDSNHLNEHGARERAAFLDEILLGSDAPSSAGVSVNVTGLSFKE